MNKRFLLVPISATLAALAACDNTLIPLEPGSYADLGYINVDAHFCTSPPDPAEQKIKYLFVLDHSQSNQPGFPNPLTPNDVTSTDPQGNRRYGPLVEFVKTLAPDPYNLTSFSLIDFNDTAYVPTGIPSGGFETNSTTFLQDAQTDWIGTGSAAQPAPADKGFTNYQAALQLALSTILADAQTEAANPVQPIVTVSYHIVFVSDGVPTVAVTGTPPIYTQDFNKDLLPVIQKLIGIKNDPALGPHISGIELDTAYYFTSTQIPAAESLLQEMAVSGNGHYFQFGSGQDIAYQDFAPPSRAVKYLLQDAWVDNSQAVWWDDGRILMDSGGGGMPDVIRLPLGGVAGTSDSDGNGVRDLVEYRSKDKVCNDPGCAPAGRDPYAICDGLEPVIASDGTVSFPDTSKSGLNDCEAFILGTSLNTFSTNGSFIPDFLAFKNGLPILGGTDGSQADPFGDGMSNYEKLKAGLPISISKNSVHDFLSRVTTLTHEDSPSPDTDCYHLVTQNVAVLGKQNRIQVSFIQNAAVLDDKPVIVTSSKLAPSQDTTLYFTPADFTPTTP